MAQFYASIQGNRGEATRMGGRASGIQGHIRGWGAGVEVIGRENADGEDEFEVYATGGSGGGSPRKLIAVVYQDKDTGEVKVGGRLAGMGLAS